MVARIRHGDGSLNFLLVDLRVRSMLDASLRSSLCSRPKKGGFAMDCIRFGGAMLACGALSSFVLGCSAPVEGNERGESATTRTTEATVLPFDIPPKAAAVEVLVPVGEFSFHQLWVFACDQNHHLKRRVKFSPVDPWADWENLNNGCQDGLTVGDWHRPDVEQVFLYMRGTDNHLWQLWYNLTHSGTSSGWTNMSSATGIGTISGAPTLLSYFATYETNPTMYINLGVTTDLHNLLVLSSDGYSWWYDHVYRSPGSSKTVATTNPITSTGQAWGQPPDYAPVFSGRGLWTTDDANSWTATSTSDGWAVVDTWTGSTGTSTFIADHASLSRFGTSLQMHEWSGGAWSTLYGCNVAGAPQVSNGRWYGFVPGITGDLQFWYAYQEGNQLEPLCTSLGGSMNSAPYQFNYNGSESNALFKGSNGDLWIYLSDGTLQDLAFALP
jgi:hypothetical protein